MDASAAQKRLNKALDNLVYVTTLKERQKQAVKNPRAIICGEPGHPTDQPVQAQPWSRADLFRRARTFKSSTWFCKPDAVNAVECAKHGWINTDIDKLQCEFCLARIGFPALQTPSPTELSKAAETFHAMLSNAHEDTCFWKNNATPLHLAAFPTMPPEQCQQEFDTRVDELQHLPAALPPVSNSLPHHMDSTTWSRVERLARQGPSRPAPPHTNQHHVDSLLFATARMLALFGWHGSTLEAPAENKGGSPGAATGDVLGGPSGGSGGDATGASPVLYCAYCGAARLLHAPTLHPAAATATTGALEGSLVSMKQRAADAAAQAAALRGTTLGTPGALRLTGALCTPVGGAAHTIAGGAMQASGTPRVGVGVGGGMGGVVRSTSGVVLLGETIAGGRLTPVVTSASSSPTHHDNNTNNTSIHQEPSPSSAERPGRPASTAWQQPPSKRHDVVSASTFHTWLAGFGGGGSSNSAASSPTAAAAAGGNGGSGAAGGSAAGGNGSGGTTGGNTATTPSSGPFGGGTATGGVVPLFGVAAMRAAAVQTSTKQQTENTQQTSTKRPASLAGEEDTRPAKRVATDNPPITTTTILQPPPVPQARVETSPVQQQCAHVNTMADVFDPIQHHRSFCPWIASPKGVDVQGCGWRATLDVLVPGTEGGDAVGTGVEEQGERDREWSASRALKAILPKLQMRI